MSSNTAKNNVPGRAPDIQTSFIKRVPTDQQGLTDVSKAQATATTSTARSLESKHQRFVLVDPVAFSYLEEDPSSKVLDRSRQLEGYQCYLVEQWACSRISPTFLVVAHTGDASHKITVGVLSVPSDEDSWSPRMKVYFKALLQDHARKKETALGTLMITNLNGFPSSLTVILVPGGDPRKCREDFFVNENLKRLDCSGRVGISLGQPTAATKAKFLQLYKTSEMVSLYSSVIELVKLCQVALMLFGVLEPEYADGLLCDVTERAIGDWWVKIGNDLYNVEPTDGVLGPTTVAALVGTLMGARNRLHAFGAPVAKDVFEIEQTKRGIMYFQRACSIPRSRRLDRRTLDRLHRATDKQASGDGWTVPRAVKSTVAELSGKGGEMVMDIVGGREKVGIADIETTDIDRLASLVNGERSKWLWQGKPRKRTTRDLFSESLGGDEGLIFQEDEENGYSWAGRRKDSTIEPLKTRPRTYGSFRTTGESTDMDPALKQTMLRRAKGRLKGAVGIKGHVNNRSKDENMDYGRESFENKSDEILEASPKAQEVIRKSYESEMSPKSPKEDKEVHPVFHDVVSETPAQEAPPFVASSPFGSTGTDDGRPIEPETPLNSVGSPLDSVADYTRSPPSVTSPPQRRTDYFDNFYPSDPKSITAIPRSLRQTRSFSTYPNPNEEPRHPARWTRHLSFSTAESSVLTWAPISPSPETLPRQGLSPKTALKQEKLLAASAKHMQSRIAHIARHEGAWMQARLAALRALDTTAAQDTEQLQALYYPRQDEFSALSASQERVLEAGKSALRDATGEVDALAAKLEYEVNALRAKVEDVEDAVKGFERQVEYIEGRLVELVDQQVAREGLGAWMMRVVRGVRGGGAHDQTAAK